MTVDEYEKIYGTIESPMSLVTWMINSSRRSGKTTQLIKTLPETEKYVVVAFSAAAARDIEKKVYGLRGEEVANRGKFITMFDLNKLAGLDYPVYVDNAVFDVLNMDYVRKVNLGWRNNV